MVGYKNCECQGFDACSLRDLWERVKGMQERLNNTVTSINSLIPDGSGHIEMFVKDLRDGQALLNQVTSILSHLSTHDGLIAALQAHDAILDGQIVTINNTLTSIQGTITSINSQIVTINARLLTNETQIANMGSQIADALTHIGQLHALVDTMQSQINSMLIAIAGKLDKNTTPNKVYATDASGQQVMIDKPGAAPTVKFFGSTPGTGTQVPADNTTIFEDDDFKVAYSGLSSGFTITSKGATTYRSLRQTTMCRGSPSTYASTTFVLGYGGVSGAGNGDSTVNTALESPFTPADYDGSVIAIMQIVKPGFTIECSIETNQTKASGAMTKATIIGRIIKSPS